METKEITIEISLEEYKELLMIKGKYEELKANTRTTTTPLYPHITYNGEKWNKDLNEERKVTC